MNNFLFQTIRKAKLKRNKFNLSHDVKLSMRMGQLVPILCQDVLPGDTFKLNTELLIRFAPLVAPVMHRINVYTHFFFVPKRLIWDNWKTFITGGETGTEAPSYPRMWVPVSSDHSVPSQFCTGSLADYLGFPVCDPGVNGDLRFKGSQTGGFYIDELPFRAYQLIWNEYYRDQNLQDEVDIRKEEDGYMPTNLYNQLWFLKSRAWTKDYFTSALPFAQRGEPVTTPLYGSAAIRSTDEYMQTLVPHSAAEAEAFGASPAEVINSDFTPGNGNLFADNGVMRDGTTNAAQSRVYTGNSTIDIQELAKRLRVDLTNVSSATIVELRNAFKAQEFLEAQARGGSRYIEYILNIFGVRSSDARLQRPEYLGGGKQPVVVSDVMQTSQTTTGANGSALATPAGTAASLGKTHSFKRYFEEHGYVIGIMSVLPEPCYQQGMPKQFTKFDRYDHYLPQFARIGEQEIVKGELYFDPTTQGNTELFGYAPRYAEYKFINSSVHGDFRTDLKYWHLGRIFDKRPVLNGPFVMANPSDRIFAVEDSSVDKLWVNIHHNFAALRPMPLYGTPSM